MFDIVQIGCKGGDADDTNASSGGSGGGGGGGGGDGDPSTVRQSKEQHVVREARDVPDTLAEAKFDPSRPGAAEEKHPSSSTSSSLGGSAKLCVTHHVQDEFVGLRHWPPNMMV